MALIVLIDDDEDFSMTIGEVLSSDGHGIVRRMAIEDGLRLLRNVIPDLLILDLVFPEDSEAGVRLARTIREPGGEFGHLRRVPILLMTAVSERDAARKAVSCEARSGPMEYLEKPVDLDVLRKKVDDILRHIE